MSEKTVAQKLGLKAGKKLLIKLQPKKLRRWLVLCQRVAQRAHPHVCQGQGGPGQGAAGLQAPA
jgi:hypothetical protein